MKLLDSIDQKTIIEKIIEENGGELTPEHELHLDDLHLQISEQTDSIHFAIENRKTKIKTYREYIKALQGKIKSEEEQQKQFNEFLVYVIKKHGELKTELSSLKVQKRSTERVIIENFDLCMRTYPDAVVITLNDNVKKITLQKNELKKLGGSDPIGFKIVENDTEFLSSRMRMRKDNE